MAISRAALAKLAAWVNVKALVGYTLSKQGGDGGYLSFQFMDMFESSAEDTYYAVSTLLTLGVEPPRASDTVEFLSRLQSAEGSYSSVEVAFYALKTLRLLGSAPRDPKGAAAFLSKVLSFAAARRVESLPRDERPLIDEQGVLRSKDATYLITSADVLPTPVVVSMAVQGLKAVGSIGGEDEEKAFKALLKHFEKFNGAGFSLDIAYWTLEALAALGREPPRGLREELTRLVLVCESPEGGFSATPYSRTAFVENLFFGLRVMRQLRLRAEVRAEPRLVRAGAAERERRLQALPRAGRVEPRVHVLRCELATGAFKPPLACLRVTY
uniref:Prenyltransferase alpha-alpha toroid domain-containing protein n=1 Tax=Thermofilum pendens TaxID=2269 RepID=A0A7C4FCC8_THEPE